MEHLPVVYPLGVHPALAPLGLSDPYEPLIVMYERGGGFRMEHGFVDFGETMIAVGFRQALQRTPLPTLDRQTLDPMGAGEWGV